MNIAYLCYNFSEKIYGSHVKPSGYYSGYNLSILVLNERI